MAFDLPRRLAESVRRLLTQPADELTRWQRALRFSLNLTRYCAKKLERDRAREMAAALTYHTLFSLLPMLAVSLAALALFVGPEERQSFEERVVDLLLPPAVIATEPLAADGAAPDAAPPTEDARRREFQEARREVGERFETLLNTLEGVNFRRIGIVGLLVFIYASTALLANIEASFNAVLGARSSRPWYLRLPLYYTVITLGPLALVGGVALQGRALDWLATDELTAWLAGPIFVLSPVVSAWLLLFLMFVLLPTARVARGPAAVGSLVSALLWVAGKELFGTVVTAAYEKGTAAAVYGSLALVLLFLLWLWLTWILVLFGLELTVTIQALHGGGLEHLPEFGGEEGFVDVRWALPLAALVARRFEQGDLAETDDVAEALGLPRRPVRRLLEALADAGLVRRVEERRRAGWLLGRPAAQISLEALMKAVEPLLPSAPDSPASRRAGELATWLPDEATATTLAELAGEPEERV